MHQLGGGLNKKVEGRRSCQLAVRRIASWTNFCNCSMPRPSWSFKEYLQAARAGKSHSKRVGDLTVNGSFVMLGSSTAPSIAPRSKFIKQLGLSKPLR